jgi:hypothetical protein
MWNSLTGAKQASDAAKRQAEYYGQATNELGALSGDKYAKESQGITDRLATGGLANVNQEDFQNKYVAPMTQQYNQSVLPSLAESFRSNPWAQSRMRGQENAANAFQSSLQSGYNEMQNQANQNQLAALNAIQGNAQARAGVYTGQAGSVQAAPSGAQQFGNALSPVSSLAGLASMFYNPSKPKV